MIKINQKIYDMLKNISGIGYYCDYGAVIGDAEFIIVDKNQEGLFLAHTSEIKSNGLFVKLKEE